MSVRTSPAAYWLLLTIAVCWAAVVPGCTPPASEDANAPSPDNTISPEEVAADTPDMRPPDETGSGSNEQGTGAKLGADADTSPPPPTAADDDSPPSKGPPANAPANDTDDSDAPSGGTPSSDPPPAEATPAEATPAAGPASDASAGLPDKGPPPLFEGWPKPRFVFLITGRQHGYIEPCGCTGLTNQKGGLARRYRLHRQMQDRGWTVVPIDVGNQVRRYGRQAEIKFQVTVDALGTMDYQAVTFGPDDIRLSTGELVAATVGDDTTPSPFLSANIGIIDRSLTPTHRILTVADTKIGITAVLGDSHVRSIQSDEIVHRPAADGLREVWPLLKEGKTSINVLLAHGTIEESQKLAAQFPDFDIVVTAGGAGEPTYKPQAIPGTDAVMVQVGTKGMFAGVIGVFDDEKTPIRYQRVPLDAQFKDSREMLQLLAAYQQQLQNEGLDQLGIREIAHPSGRKYVGSDACAECHEDAYDVWKESPHAHATDSLIRPGERSEIARHFDPECLSCHVTGWNPQKYIPYKSGYLSLKGTPKMVGSGCENCHGPGSRHVAAENGDIDVAEDELLKLRKEMRLPYKSARDACLKCHDLDNSPDFHVEGAFEEFWEQVAH